VLDDSDKIAPPRRPARFRKLTRSRDALPGKVRPSNLLPCETPSNTTPSGPGTRPYSGRPLEICPPNSRAGSQCVLWLNSLRLHRYARSRRSPVDETNPLFYSAPRPNRTPLGLARPAGALVKLVPHPGHSLSEDLAPFLPPQCSHSQQGGGAAARP